MLKMNAINRMTLMMFMAMIMIITMMMIMAVAMIERDEERARERVDKN
jgi:hypothetical protein